MPDRHFVKYTFLKVDPAWRRLDSDVRAEGKREFLAACEDFAEDHLLQSFTLVGTRGDTDLMLSAEAENLDRIHEFHVVLAQSGLMKWCTTPYSFLGMRKSSEYSDDQRAVKDDDSVVRRRCTRSRNVAMSSVSKATTNSWSSSPKQ